MWCITCISFICVEIFEFMDAGKPSLEKRNRELVSWTNSIKSNDSSKLATKQFFLLGIRHIIINNKFYCQGNRTVCFREKNAGCVDKFKTICC